MPQLEEIRAVIQQRIPDAAKVGQIAAILDDDVDDPLPDLLACCKRALTDSARVHPDFMKQLKAAISKAHG